ncbi:MAG: DUF4410 domain-containing protein [Candidatus Sulfotelmatobacter sp.]
MKALRNAVRFVARTGSFKWTMPLCGVMLGLGLCSSFAGPLAAKVKVTSLQSYSGSPLAKPDKILIYDLVADPSDVQVDASQKIRPRHLITGDEKPEAIAHKAQSVFAAELQKKLAKTGLPIEHVAADIAPSNNSLVIQGSFLTLHQGMKTERVVVGMGTGSAALQTKIDVRLKTPAEVILLSQFQTETTKAKNIGGAVPVAAGLNPEAVAAKSTIADRKKTLNAYASKTADASAAEILKAMASQGWIKLNDKGEVIL